MTRDFTVQFTDNFTQLEGRSGRGPIAITTRQIIGNQHQLLLEQQKCNQEILQGIEAKMEKICLTMQSFKREVESIALHFAEIFTSMIFSRDSELALEKVQTQVQACLNAFQPLTEITVWVHPSVQSEIEAYCRKLEHQALLIRADPLLETSDCRVEGPEGGLIARLENQLDVCRQQLLTTLATNL